MALSLILMLTAVGSLIALQDWRKGMFFAIIIANLLDPVRKTVPSAPSYLMLLSIAIVVSTALGMLLDRSRFRRHLRKTVLPIENALVLFCVLILPACAISATYGTNSWMFTILGIFSYGVLFSSVFIGYYFTKNPQDLHKFMAFYCVISSIFLIGGWVEYLGLYDDWDMIGTSALETAWIRYAGNFQVALIAGFHRSPDVMGWHAAAVTIFSLILAINAKPKDRLFWLVIGAFAFSVLLLCGRRKMVFMVPLFLATSFAIRLYLSRKRSAFSIAPMLLAPALSIFLSGSVLGEDSEYIRYYTETGDQAAEQFQAQTFETALVTVYQAGFWGNGLGFATPGAHSIPGERPYTWQESGTSRVLSELGIPGAIGFLAVLMVLIKQCLTAVRYRFRQSPTISTYPIGLFAFFIANLGSLVVSGQILADPFIALVIGFSSGAVVAFGRQSVPLRQTRLVAP